MGQEDHKSADDNAADDFLSLHRLRSLEEALADLIAKHDRCSPLNEDLPRLARMIRQLEAEIVRRGRT
jgi:chemotaxis protein histidine kinase CheA